MAEICFKGMTDNVEMTDYEIRRHIIPVFVSNEKMRSDNLVKTGYLNMGVIFRSLIGYSMNGNPITVSIEKSFAKRQGLTADSLFAEAMQGIEDVIPIEIEGINDVLSDDFGEEVPFSPLYVASYKCRQLGAPVIFRPDVAGRFCSMKECNGFYILPSSIHETLLLTDEYATDLSITPESMKEMVIKVNHDLVCPEIKLSDSIYHYSLQTGEYTIVIE